MLSLLMFLIIALCVGFLFMEGMWSNAIRLVNVVTAALLATNYFEPVADWLDGLELSYTFAWDFLALWGLFVLFGVIFRLLTDFASRVKVRFLKVADQVGSTFFAFWIGWVMVGFTMFSLHLAPLAREPFGGGFQPEQRMFLGFAPDRQWLGFVQKVSRGQFARGLSEEEIQKKAYGAREGDAEWEQDLAVFDRTGELLPKYATRRAALEGHMQKKETRSIRIQPEDPPW
jgi:uncharacterized membrane protein required for colicin V production